MQRVADNYRKIRNTFRYILGNLSDFDPQKDGVPFSALQAIDQYMLRQTAGVVEDARRWYEEFAFHKIYHGINHFCVVELSAFYFDVLKDRLYTASPKSKRAGRHRPQSGGLAKRWCACWPRLPPSLVKRFGSICQRSKAAAIACIWKYFRMPPTSPRKWAMLKKGRHGRRCVRCAKKS